MIEQIKTLITSSNELYEVEYEEARMMNLKADEKSLTTRFAYIEEFVQGSYSRDKFRRKKITQVQIYFCRFGKLDSTAMDRENIRTQIESEVIMPFMEKYNASGLFEVVEVFRFFTPPPRFDANEISVMLQFDCKQLIC